MGKSTIIKLAVAVFVVLLLVVAYRLLWTFVQPKVEHRLAGWSRVLRQGAVQIQRHDRASARGIHQIVTRCVCCEYRPTHIAQIGVGFVQPLAKPVWAVLLRKG